MSLCRTIGRKQRFQTVPRVKMDYHRQMKGRILRYSNALHCVLLIGFCLIVGVWVRSYSYADGVNWKSVNILPDKIAYRTIAIGSVRGGMEIFCSLTDIKNDQSGVARAHDFQTNHPSRISLIDDRLNKDDMTSTYLVMPNSKHWLGVELGSARTDDTYFRQWLCFPYSIVCACYIILWAVGTFLWTRKRGR